MKLVKRINCDNYTASCAPADAQTTLVTGQANPHAPDEGTNRLGRSTERKRVRFEEKCEKTTTCEREPLQQATPCRSERVTATALVSKSAAELLTSKVLLAGELHVAHLDSCASHCFVSTAMSAYLTSMGYPQITSPIWFEVNQGNPLCDTNRVHLCPLSMVSEDGTVCTWDSCLFLVADAGAPIILCCSLLRLGGILHYEPPPEYETILSRCPRSANRDAQLDAANMRRGTFYHPPTRTSSTPLTDTTTTPEAKCLRSFTTMPATPSCGTEPEQDGVNSTEIVSSFSNSNSRESDETTVAIEPTTVASVSTAPTTSTDPNMTNNETTMEKSYSNSRMEGELPSRGTALFTGAPVKDSPTPKKRKGSTDMLTPENPYGRNPPLPEEVMEAVRHLKLLSDPNTTPTYSLTQMDEIRKRFQEDRPSWANCLTFEHTRRIADEETEQFLYDLMDKPKYQESIFASNLRECCDLGEYELNQKPGIDTWIPPQHRKYKNPVMVKIVDDWLDFLLSTNKARESTATHPAVVTIILREGKEPRVCVDYRNRNSRTEVPIFPMPNVDDFLEDNAGFKYYCSFDMAKMFNQFKIKEAHKHLAAFITHRGVYEPNVVLFGLAGGPQHAVRECGGAMAKDPLTNGVKFTEWAMEQNALGVQPPYEICPSTKVVKGSRLKPFIDDVTIPSNHKEGMKKLVEYFFEFCHKHHLILSRKKAQIMRSHLRMLGFVVSEQGKHLDPHRIVSLLEAEKPRSKETLHSMLSSYTFIRMFIPNFSAIAAPLYEATKGIIWKGPLSGRSLGTRQVDPGFEWTPEMTRAYEQLRNSLLEAPILSKIDWNYPLFLSVDACIRGEGWVLWQLITTSDGVKVAVAIKFGSRKYNETESNWETTRQEASAIRSALTDVYDYVFGQHFYVFSDHLNLRFMHNSINRAVLRMRDFLSQFNMTVVHCPGVWNNADAISRLQHAELAQKPSATTASLEGVSMSISTGTCMAEDKATVGSVLNVYEYHEHRQPGSGDFHPVRVLRTQAIVCSAASCCLLCDATEERENDSPSTLEENDYELLPEEYPTATPTLPGGNMTATLDLDPGQDASRNEYRSESDLNDLADLWATRSHLPTETLRKEAQLWNQRMKTPTKVDTEVPSKIDLEDLEDLDWCESFDRTAYALRSPVSVRFVQQVEPSPYHDLQKTRQETEVEETVYETKRTTVYEIADRGTQTTPADFRVASIRTPLREDFAAIHNNESGHHGLDFSYRKLLKRCGSKWANERGEATKTKALLKEYIDSCPICQKVRGLKERVKSKHSFIVSRPFLEVSYDFIVFKTEDKNGNRYLIVAIDNFMKLVEIKPVKNRDAETVVKFLLELQSRYGPMARLRYDREKSFTSLLVTKLNEYRGTEGVPCIPYHPQANSICERQNGIIMEHMNALILGCKLGPETKASWSDLVPFIFSIVNNTPKNPLGISPLSMLYGVFANYDQPLLPTTQANKVGEQSNALDYLESLTAWQNKLMDITEQIQSDHFAKQDKKLNGDKEEQRQFNVGDFVLQRKQATKISGKPGTRWIGPFLVMDRRDNDPTHPVLDLMNMTDMKVKEASIEDCRLFNTTWFDEDNLIPELIKLSAIDENEYVVERILSHKPLGKRGKLPLSKYLFEVKWQDFDDTTWEPYLGLKDLEPFEQYAKDHPELKIPLTTE